MRTVIYTVHEPDPAPVDPIARADATVFVKEGFAWLALITPFLWLLFHRLWWALLGFVIVGVLIAMIPALLTGDPSAGQYPSLLINVIMGFIANDLRRWTLDRNGFVHVATVQGPSREAAEFRYFEAHEAHGADPAPTPAPASAPAPTPGQTAEGRGRWRPQGPAEPARTTGEPAIIGMFPEPEGGR